MKLFTRIFIILALAGAGFWGWSQWGASSSSQVLSTAPVLRGDVTDSVLASGVIEAKELVSVGAQTSGQIETLAVTLGQDVQAGDMIAQIDAQDQQNALLQAKADLAQIEAQIAAKHASLREAELVLERQKELQKKDLIAEETIESATSEFLVLSAELGALEAQKSSAQVNVSTAQIALDRTTISAPISGTIVAVVVDQGQTVSATSSAPTIVKIANLDRMLVKAEISEADVVRVREGQDVSFTILGEPEVNHAAVVRQVEPAPAEIAQSDTISTDSAVYYNGILEVENPDHTLRIGMTTQVSIIIQQAKDTLTIPAAALGSAQDGQTTVELFDPATGATRTQPVTVGLNNRVTAEILSGLEEGQRVVTGKVLSNLPSDESSSMGPPPMGF